MYLFNPRQNINIESNNSIKIISGWQDGQFSIQGQLSNVEL